MPSFLKPSCVIACFLSMVFANNAFAFAKEEPLPDHIEKLFIKGVKGFPLSATLYKGDPKAAGVLMLHDCSHDSASYEDLGNLFAHEGINALALDARGFGKSASEIFSQKKIKKEAKGVNDYQNSLLLLQSYWDKDVLLAYEFLQKKLVKGQRIAVIASGCAVNQGVAIAEQYRVNSFVFISPLMDYMEKERYKNLIDIPTFFVSAIHHTDSYHTASELFLWNGDYRSAVLTYKGNRSGDSLHKGKEHLSSGMAKWVEKNLHHVPTARNK